MTCYWKMYQIKVYTINLRIHPGASGLKLEQTQALVSLAPHPVEGASLEDI